MIGVAIKRFFEIAISSLEIGWTAYFAFSGPADCVAWPHRIDSAPLIDGGRAWVPGLIVATDKGFSSNRFAWAHEIHKLDLQVELKEAAPAQDAGRCQPAEPGVSRPS